MLGVGNNDIEDIGAIVVQHFSNCLAQVSLVNDAFALDPETLADLWPVGIERPLVFGSADIVRVTEDGLPASEGAAVLRQLRQLTGFG